MSSGYTSLSHSPIQHDDNIYSGKYYGENEQNKDNLQQIHQNIESELEKAQQHQHERLQQEYLKKQQYENEIDNMRQVMNEIEGTLDKQEREKKLEHQSKRTQDEIYQDIYKKKSEHQYQQDDEQDFPQANYEQYIHKYNQQQSEPQTSDKKQNENEEEYENNYIKPKYGIQNKENKVPRYMIQTSSANNKDKQSNKSDRNCKQQNQVVSNLSSYHRPGDAIDQGLARGVQQQIRFQQLLNQEKEQNQILNEEEGTYNEQSYNSSRNLRNNVKDNTLSAQVQNVKKKVRSQIQNPNKTQKFQHFQTKQEPNHCCKPEKYVQEPMIRGKRDEIEIEILGHRRQCHECAYLLNRGQSTNMCQHHGTFKSKQKPQKQLPKRFSYLM